jgi:hypothetical protein
MPSGPNLDLYSVFNEYSEGEAYQPLSFKGASGTRMI